MFCFLCRECGQPTFFILGDINLFNFIDPTNFEVVCENKECKVINVFSSRANTTLSHYCFLLAEKSRLNYIQRIDFTMRRKQEHRHAFLLSKKLQDEKAREVGQFEEEQDKILIS